MLEKPLLKISPKKIARMKNREYEGWLLVSPAILLILAFFFLPLLLTFLRGFGLFNLLGESKFTLKYYSEFFKKPYYRSAMFYTFYIGIGSTIGSLLIAFPFCVLLRKKFPGKTIVSALFKAPLVIPSLIAVFMIMTIVAKGGLLNQILLGLGILKNPLTLMQDKAGIGIFLVQIWKNVPFMTVIILAVMEGINPELFEAARNLGATEFQVVRRVLLPLSLPGISAASILVFIKAFGGYVIPKLMGPVYPVTLPILMYTKAQEDFDWAMSSALATIVAITAAIVMIIYGRLTQKSEEVLRR